MKKLHLALFVPAHEFRVVDVDSEVLIRKNQKNKMIIFRGSTFKKLKQSSQDSFKQRDNTISEVFICSRESEGCRCHFILSTDGNGRLIDDHKMTLKHSVDIYREQRYQFKCHVAKCLADSKNIHPFDIINKYLKNYEISIYTPSLNYFTSTICKLKQEGLGTIPQNYQELNIEKLKELGEGFEIEEITYTDGDKENHMLLIYNDWQLEQARSMSMFLGDGTFKNVPKMFQQLFVIHSIIAGQGFPLFFVLTESKTEVMYTKLFSRLKELGVTIDTYLSDYEVQQRKGVLNSYKERQPKLVGCLFHLYQNIIKHVKKESLGTYYTNDKEVNKLIHLYFALPFIDKREMNVYIEIIVKKIEQMNNSEIKEKCFKFHSYFMKTWIEGNPYQSSDWNQCGDMNAMTNNWSEGFNSAFGRRFARSHPNPLTLIETLSNVMKYYRFLKSDIMIHRDKYKDTSYSELATEITIIQSEKETTFHGDPEAYLSALANVQLRIIVRQQMEYYKENKIKHYEVQQIKEMFAGKRELSLIIEDSDEIQLKIKHKKLEIITKHLNKKRSEYVKEIIKKGNQTRKRKAVDCVMNETEKSKLNEEMNSVNEEMVKNDKLEKYRHEYRKMVIIDHDLSNEFEDHQENSLSFSTIVNNNNINNNSNLQVNENSQHSEEFLNINNEIMMNEEQQDEPIEIDEQNGTDLEEDVMEINQFENQQMNTISNEIEEVEQPSNEIKIKERKQNKRENERKQKERKQKPKRGKKKFVEWLNKSVRADLRKTRNKKHNKSSEMSEESSE